MNNNLVAAPTSSLGWLTWWTIPQVSVSYDAVNDLLADAGMHRTLNPPTARNAWRKATQTSKRGLKLPIDPATVAQVAKDTGSRPHARLYTRMVSRSGRLRRHLVLEIVVPEAQDTPEQRRSTTAAVLEFQAGRYTHTVVPDPDPQGWIDHGQIAGVVAAMEDRFDELANKPDAQHIRALVRDYLAALRRVPMRGTGGVYFVPDTVKRDKVFALRTFIRSLIPHAQGDLPPACSIVRLIDDEAHTIRDDVAESIIDDFRDRAQALADRVSAIRAGTSTGKPAQRVADSAMEDLLLLKQSFTDYQNSLGLELDELAIMLDLADTAASNAYTQAYAQKKEAE
jgi:predicted pyridoxine 5'-phosphate oxidase superfamily flavin-nucleotide-binding protein